MNPCRRCSHDLAQSTVHYGARPVTAIRPRVCREGNRGHDRDRGSWAMGELPALTMLRARLACYEGRVSELALYDRSRASRKQTVRGQSCVTRTLFTHDLCDLERRPGDCI